jgi:hypothetical protein
MTSVLDVWRAIDPEARLVSGAVAELTRPARGVMRTRALAPHLPSAVDGELLIVDATLVIDGRLDGLLAVIHDAGLQPCGLVLAPVDRPATLEPADSQLPILASGHPVAALEGDARAYLEDEPGSLAELRTSIRLTGSEAALVDPQPGAPGAVVASRLRRGVAVVVDGRLQALNPRPAGRALAAAFTAAFVRLLADAGDHDAPARRTAGGLWVTGRRLGAGASAWLFDDLPFARVDLAALDALSVTLRALLRRPAPAPPSRSQPRRQPPSSGDPLRDTLLAVARANGRVAPAARALGVHRNTVLYRLRRASAEQGIDPRRPEDALRLLRDTERSST